MCFVSPNPQPSIIMGCTPLPLALLKLLGWLPDLQKPASVSALRGQCGNGHAFLGDELLSSQRSASENSTSQSEKLYVWN